MSDDESPIRPELFTRVKEYTDSVLKGTVTPDSNLGDNTPIIVFYFNFFLQFFEKVLRDPITGFDEQEQDRADRIRLSLDGPEHAATRQLIVRFEDFCELQPDLKDGLYFTHDHDFWQFHEQYIPRLLESIQGWATSATLPEIADLAKQALDYYKSAVAYLRKTYGRG